MMRSSSTKTLNTCHKAIDSGMLAELESCCLLLSVATENLVSYWISGWKGPGLTEETRLLEPSMVLTRMASPCSPSLNRALDYSHERVCLQGGMSCNTPCFVLIKVMTERVPKCFVITLQINEILLMRFDSNICCNSKFRAR